MILLALSAIVIPLVLLLGFRLPARTAMIISVLAVAVIALAVWQMTPLAISASAIQGTHRALTIGLILFGAITLVRTMQATGVMDRIKLGLHAISPDMRIQTVVVAFSFIALLEGISGFGTPAVIVAPLLIVLGFRPIAAAVLALLGDTMACTFGAVATPLIVGLENVPIYSAELVKLVGSQVTIFDLIIGPLLAFGLVAVLVVMFGNQTKHQKIKSLLEIAPWALFIGLIHALSAVVLVRIIGPEFTSILAGAISLSVATITARLGWLTPKTIWRHHANPDHTAEETSEQTSHIPLWKAWLPYSVVIGFLLASRLIAPVQQWLLTNLDASWTNILGISSISSTWNILYSPGIVLLIGATASVLVLKKSPKVLVKSLKSALASTAIALSALIPTLIMVQIFTNSGVNSSGLASMPLFIAQTLADNFSSLWLIAAPLLGAVGALIAGSATVSTLTMAPVQFNIAQDAGLSVTVVLALQMIGAAAGNALAIHNVVSASSVVGLVHRESLIMRRLFLPTLVYLVVVVGVGVGVLLLH